MSSRSSESWKATPIISPYRASASTSAGASPPNIAPYRGLVHHVVVVQGGKVGELHHGRGQHHVGSAAVADLRRDGREQRAEPLAARVDQVPGGLGDQRVVAGHRGVQLVLDGCERGPDRRLQAGIGQLDTDRGARYRGTWNRCAWNRGSHL